MLDDIFERFYPILLEIKDTTDTGRSASYLHLEIDSEGRLRTKLYDKRDGFNCLIVNFPFRCSNIPAAPAYGIYISPLMRYSRACGSYHDFLYRWLLLTFQNGIFWANGPYWLRWSHHFFTVATMIWITVTEYLLQMSTIWSTCRKHSWVLFLFIIYHRLVTRVTRRVPLVEQELLTLPRHLRSPPLFM